jgi:superfamily II DNA or RNA helicase
LTSWFVEAAPHVNLLGSGGEGWRRPQRGALGALMAHWSLTRPEPTVISIPTGSGKTAIALVAPLIRERPPERVLVVAPSTTLRKQLFADFESYDQLRRIGVLPKGAGEPDVHQQKGLVDDWDALKRHDVIVALPNSISPVHYGNGPHPPKDLFDLIIVDEAHHTAAKTWSAILSYFDSAAALLLTATRRRRDDRPLPGSLEFYYPLHRAIEEKFYASIDPVLLEAGDSRDENDALIAAKAAELFREPKHRTSVLLARVSDVGRLRVIANLYAAHGVDLKLLHSKLPTGEQEAILNELRDGRLRAVGIVDMLGEGFDLPAIRLLAYHDKHKSTPATAQLIGRLARVDDDFPQAPQLVTVKDADVYPALKGVLRELYSEDADWAVVLPGLLDEEIAADQEDRQFVADLPEATDEIDPPHLRPVKRALVYEVDGAWQPGFLARVPDALAPEAKFGWGTVVYSGVNQAAGMLVLVLRYARRPRWTRDPALANVNYELHVAIHRGGSPGFVLLNLDRDGMRAPLEEALGMRGNAQLAGPERIGAYLDGMSRVSVSSVGIRSTNAATRGRATYRNFMGAGVDRGLRSVDMARSALGHVMFQTDTPGGSAANAGAAVEKSKLWLTRYESLLALSGWADQTCQLLRAGSSNVQGKLLPAVDRGQQLTAWPNHPPLAAEMPPMLLGEGYRLVGGSGTLGPIEDLDLYVNEDPKGTLTNVTGPVNGRVQIVGIFNDRPAGEENLVWRTEMGLDGRFVVIDEVDVTRGHGYEPLSALLERLPPTIYFLDGTTTIGSIRYDSRSVTRAYDIGQIQTDTWPNVNIRAETRGKAAELNDGRISIHERLESVLRARPRQGVKRWILCNDGTGEIADYITIELLASGEVALGLWHAKYAAGDNAGVRVDDFQVVVAQAIRSRASLTNPELWAKLRRRIEQDESPPATFVTGSDAESDLMDLLRDDSSGAMPVPWTARNPVVVGTIAVIQPGLSVQRLRRDLGRHAVPSGTNSLHELFTVLSDTALSDGSELVILASQ